MSKDKGKAKAVTTAEQNTEMVKEGTKWVEKPVQVHEPIVQTTPATPAALSTPPAPEPEYEHVDLTQHPNSEIAELAKGIEALKGGIGAIKANGALSDIQKNIRVNESETQIKVKTLALRDKLFMQAIGGDTSLFLNLIKFRAGQMFSVNPDKLNIFLGLVETAKSDFKDPSVREQMVESNDTILNQQSIIVQANAVIKAEKDAQAKLMEQEFLVNPVKVAVEYPDQVQSLTGKQYINNAGRPAGSTGTPKQDDIQLGDKEGVPDQDHKDLMAVTTESNIQEAIMSGVDSQSNADILRWLAINKVGREMKKARHTAHSSVYVHRKKLGYA